MLRPNNERNMYGPSSNSSDDRIDLPRLLRRRRGLLLFGTVLGIAAAAFYYFIATPIYQSEVQILVMLRNSAQSNDNNNSGDGVVHQDILATHMELFASRRIVDAAIKKRKLSQLQSISEAIAKGDDPVNFIIKNLAVTRGGSGRGKEANIIQASFRDVSRTDCATVLDALVESYQTFLGDTFLNTSSEAVDLITRAKQELAKEVKAHEVAYRSFRESAPVVFSGDQAQNPHQEKLRKLEEELIDIRKKRSQVTSRLEVIAEYRSVRKTLTDIEALSLLSDDAGRMKMLFDVTREDQYSKEFQSEQPIRSEAARAEYSQLLDLIVRERTLSQKYGDDHPQVMTVRDQISAMKDFFDTNSPDAPVDGKIERMEPLQMLESFLGSLKHDLSELNKRETKVLALTAAETNSARELVRYELEDAAMQAETARFNSLYDVIVERLRNMNIIKDFGGFITEVISPPNPPLRPDWPRLPILGALGALLGLILGVGLGFVAELTDTTFKNPEDVQHAMNLPIIAHVPTLKIKRLKTEPELSHIDPMLCTVHQPGSREAEVFRSLRTSLQFSINKETLRIIQVTSPNPGDGKSTTSTNLAVSFARLGKSVLIVDCDMRRPRTHHIFGLSNREGLTNVLLGTSEISDAAVSGVAGIETLSVLPSGPIPNNPAELLSSVEFSNLLEVLREKYDVIVLDTPPVLAVSDPRIVASLADGVLVTVRIRRNGRPSAVYTREVLESLGARLLGVVINSSDDLRHYGYSDYSTSKYELEYADNTYYRKDSVPSQSI